MLRLLANENFPGDSVAALKKLGHDLIWIRTEAPGSSDPQVLARAQNEDRILVTFDKDFGELAFRSCLPASSGIILFRILMPSPEYVTRVVIAALQSPREWRGHFAVVEDHQIRMTKLPGPRK